MPKDGTYETNKKEGTQVNGGLLLKYIFYSLRFHYMYTTTTYNRVNTFAGPEI